MIKRYSLAFFIPILLATNTLNAAHIFNKNGQELEIYGLMNPNHKFSNNFEHPNIVLKDDNSVGIIGLIAKSKISNKMSSYAHIEYSTNFFVPEIILNKQIVNTLRLGYAGIKYKNFGSIDYGRNYGLIHDAHIIAHYVPHSLRNSVFSYSDNYMINRNNSLLTYRNQDIFGLFPGVSLSLQYQNPNKNRDITQQNGLGWGGALQYHNKIGLTTIGSFFSAEKAVGKKNKTSKQSSFVNAYALSAKYHAHNMYLAAFYGLSQRLTPNILSQNPHQPYIDSIENIEAVAEYNSNSGIRPSISYLESRGKNFSNLDGSFQRDSSILQKQISINTRYKFNKYISTYLNYNINLLDKDKFTKKNHISTSNIINLGLVYQF